MKKLFKLLFGFLMEKSIPNEQIGKESIYSRDELKDVLNRLYKCRDLEISNLWQRSVFLSVFLVLCFTGYSYLVLQIIDSAIATGREYVVKLSYLHVAAIILGGVSSIFSLLWIMMAKGSKAWYEVYETAISTFENNYNEKIGLPEENIMGQMGVPFSKLNSCIFSCKSGAYSVSRINILIGQLCLLIWGTVVLIHLIFLFMIKNDCFYSIEKCIFFSLIFVLLVVCAAFYIRKQCISKHLYETIYGDKGEPLSKRN